MSDEANWVDGYIPQAGDALDFSAVTTATTLDADFEDSREFGAVTMGTGIITFTGSLAATSFSDTTKLAIGVDSTVTIDGDLSLSGSASHYICNQIWTNGVLRVTGDITNTGSGSLLTTINNDNAFTIAAKGLVAESGAIQLGPNINAGRVVCNWQVGEHGLSGTKWFVRPNLNASSPIKAVADFTISAPLIFGRGPNFDTGDGYIITLGDGNGNGVIARTGGMTISGAGKFVCNCVNTNSYTKGNDTYGPYSGGVTVNSGATLEMKPETQLTTGAITVQSGATLALPESGTATLAGNLALASGAALSFNFTDAAAAPVLGMVSGKSVTLNGTKAVTVEISGDVAPSAGSYALTTCGGFSSAVVTLASGAPAWVKGITKDSGGNLILVCRSAVWTGGAGNGSMSDGENWEGGTAPSAGDALDFSAVTIATTLAADFKDARAFGAVTMGTGIITFTGSLAATSFSDTGKLVLGTNATVTVNGDFVFSGSTAQYLAYTICSGAVLRVTGDIINNGTGGLLPCPNGKGTGEFTIAAKGLVSASGAIDTMPQTVGLAVLWEIGEDGISGEKLIGHASIGSSSRFTAKADFTFTAPMRLGKVFTFDTGDGYTITLGDGDDNGWLVHGGRMEIDGTGKLVCNCVNTNSYTYASNKDPYGPYSGEVKVLSGATLEMKPETQLTTGAITVQSGATLALPESGTVTLAGPLTLASGAALSFNFTDAGTAPVLGMVSGKSVTLRDAKAVTVNISGNALVKNVPYALTTCGGFGSAKLTLAAGAPDWAELSVDDTGNLVLGRKKKGFILVFR